MDIVRVLRIVEIIGPREAVEKQVRESLHGAKRVHYIEGNVLITAVTVSQFPEIIDNACKVEEFGKYEPDDIPF